MYDSESYQLIKIILSTDVTLLTQTERDFLDGTREFTKPQQRYIRCRLKEKLRLLGDELQLYGIPYSSSSVAANTSGSIVAGCNGSEKTY